MNTTLVALRGVMVTLEKANVDASADVLEQSDAHEEETPALVFAGLAMNSAATVLAAQATGLLVGWTTDLLENCRRKT